MLAIQVKDPSQVAEARRSAVKLATRYGFDTEDAGRVAIVASELATNLLKHAGGGELLMGSFDDNTGMGIEILSLDRGPGITDVAASIRDGFSTAGSSGTGLGAVRRGSHVSEIYSSPGLGTAILARLCPGRPNAGEMVSPTYGAVSIPIRGETICGDGWCHHATPTHVTLMVSDGLGHGPLANDASSAAARIFRERKDLNPAQLLELMGHPLKATRGAAVAIARLDFNSREVIYAGVGNITGSIVQGDGTVKRMVSHNGIVGHVIKRIQEFAYSVEHRSLVIMASDGLGTSWALNRYPGLSFSHPTLIAGVLYRDFARGRDDVTVLVVRGDPA